MMDNYEDMRLGANIRPKEISEVRENGQDFAQFDFGAEILAAAAATSNNSDEQAAKADKTIKTKTLEPKQEPEIGAKVPQEYDNNDDEEEEDSDEEEDDEDTDEDCDDDDSNSNSSSGSASSGNDDWKLRWLQREFYTGRVPRQVIASIMPHFATGLNNLDLPDDTVLWDYLAHLLNEPKRRTKLSHVNTFDDVIDLLQKSQRIIVLTGAGVSVSCGIPDFRSTNGIYARLAHDFPDLPDPQAMFDINYFKRDPRPFYKFAREIYPGEFQPSPCHRFIKMLESKGKLLRNYTQNIDTLERVAGIQRVIECHGSFSTASCTKCRFKCNADDLRKDIFAQRIPVCPQCQPNKEQSVDASVAVTEEELKLLVENGIMKPDIVFFGEGLPDEYHTVMATDKDKCDLLIVIGSSLKVRPVAHIPSSIPGSVPQILINREQLHHLKFDVELLGDSDVIINQICHRLSTAADQSWQELCCDDIILRESKTLRPTEYHRQRHMLDTTDTQSLKSNGSAAGTCSDSGFESSSADRAAIERIKSDILVELNETSELSSSAGYRHLSIDSSKDSGIEQCDSSNLVQETKTATPSSATLKSIKRQTAAERLETGSFYCHSNNYSYVFPGAQVFWDNEYSDDDEDEGEGADIFGHDNEVDDEEEDACDLNAVPLSPLLPPSLEEHIVTEIASGFDISPSQKRAATATVGDGNTPLKRRRPSREEKEAEESPPAASSSTFSCVNF